MVPTLSVRDVAARLQAEPSRWLVLDVREPAEVAQSALTGPEVHFIPLGELVARWQELPQGRAVAVICRSGGRSAKAVAWLREQGVEAVNVAGGMVAWRREIAPELPPAF